MHDNEVKEVTQVPRHKEVSDAKEQGKKGKIRITFKKANSIKNLAGKMSINGFIKQANSKAKCIHLKKSKKKKIGKKENQTNEPTSEQNRQDEESNQDEEKRRALEDLREVQINALMQITHLDREDIVEIVAKFTNEDGVCELDKGQFIKLYAILHHEPLEKLTSIANFAFSKLQYIIHFI